jgi:hypothetical protein
MVASGRSETRMREAEGTTESFAALASFAVNQSTLAWSSPAGTPATAQRPRHSYAIGLGAISPYQRLTRPVSTWMKSDFG